MWKGDGPMMPFPSTFYRTFYRTGEDTNELYKNKRRQ